MQHIVTISSGIQRLEEINGGYPGNVFNVVETPDHQAGLLILAHFLLSGLKNGELCTLVTFEDPLAFFQSLSAWNFEFYEYLKSEQLVFLFYQPNVTTEIGLTNDYSGLFGELDRLSGNTPHRVALQQMDSLLNLHSHTLINSCVQKLATAAAASSATYLGQYVQFNNHVYRDVRISLLKTMPGFFTLRPVRCVKETAPHFRLTLDRVPWLHTGHEELILKMNAGHGLVSAADDWNTGVRAA